MDYGKTDSTEDDRLTVRIIAEGLDEGLHIQHMHGFETGQDAVTPDKGGKLFQPPNLSNDGGAAPTAAQWLNF